MRQLHGHSPMALSLTPRALKSTSEPIGELREAHRGQTVVGIDLDMSSCSMSYRINNAGPVENVGISKYQCTPCTIPAILLLRKLYWHNCRVEHIGEKAKVFKDNLSDGDLSKYHYFDLNMLLYRYKVSTACNGLKIQHFVACCLIKK